MALHLLQAALASRYCLGASILVLCLIGEDILALQLPQQKSTP